MNANTDLVPAPLRSAPGNGPPNVTSFMPENAKYSGQSRSYRGGQRRHDGRFLAVGKEHDGAPR